MFRCIKTGCAMKFQGSWYVSDLYYDEDSKQFMTRSRNFSSITPTHSARIEIQAATEKFDENCNIKEFFFSDPFGVNHVLFHHLEDWEPQLFHKHTILVSEEIN